jgi:hypothetical protein
MEKLARLVATRLSMPFSKNVMQLNNIIHWDHYQSIVSSWIQPSIHDSENI